MQIADPLTRQPRRVQYGDIAVLAVSTWNLPLLFEHLDAEDVPYASRGGRLFLADPLSRQFLLGLRALADRDDGVAEAALLRPPFFAVGLGDLLRERAFTAGRVPEDEAVRRVREAKELIGDLRRHRLDRPPGATARDLLDRTAFARAVALGPNGPQRLARLRELCLVLEQTAAAEGLDYDGATARLREWVTDPVQLDPPHPVGAEAVQVLTVHQAKGLEFPVVVLWDGRGEWDLRLARRALAHGARRPGVDHVFGWPGVGGAAGPGVDADRARVSPGRAPPRDLCGGHAGARSARHPEDGYSEARQDGVRRPAGRAPRRGPCACSRPTVLARARPGRAR